MCGGFFASHRNGNFREGIQYGVVLPDVEGEGRFLSVWNALEVALSNLPLATVIAELGLDVQSFSLSLVPFCSKTDVV
jgi:hypothetical protein